MEDEKRLEIIKGFKLKSMVLGNAETGQEIWRTEQLENFHNSNSELRAEVPKEILQLKTVSRELTFSSVEIINRLRLQ